MEVLTQFWTEKYLEEYIKEGGSKIKFVTGRSGSGKTHLLREVACQARERGYKVAAFSAREVWLHDFKEIYLEILSQCDLMEALKRCAGKIAERMGYDSAEIPEGMSFMDYLSFQDLGDAITRREIRLQLKEMFLDNPLLDNNFALACSLLTGGILGHPLLESQNQELLLAWLHGDKTVKLSLLRSLGLSPSRITRYNARHMLRSLVEVLCQGGYTGLVVLVDDVETLLGRSSESQLRYTKMRREDTYESIRQLIDEIDSLRNIFFVFGFDRGLFDDERAGIKSYQALWMRIQNEIISPRFNCFTDVVDMDRMAGQFCTPQTLVSMSKSMMTAREGLQAGFGPEAVQPRTPGILTTEEAEKILENAGLGGLGIPGQVAEATLGQVPRENLSQEKTSAAQNQMGGGDHV